jgi:hypothetical protein
MIVEKHKALLSTEEQEALQETIEQSNVTTLEEAIATNALCEVFKAVKTILSEMHVDEDDETSPLLFKTIKLNNGQLSRIKHDKWNREYALAFPAVFLHFINVRYLVSQSRIGEGRATLRIQYVLNTLNNSDDDVELEGYRLFQRINDHINRFKNGYPALLERFQLTYFDQPESFDDGLQPYWIDYEVWFREYSDYRYRDWVDRYIVIPPFTNHSDQLPENNCDNHEDHDEPKFEDVARFEENLSNK